MINTAISSIEDLFVFEDDLVSNGEIHGTKASLKWDRSKYVIIPQGYPDSIKYAVIGALMQEYFKDIVDYIQADVMPKSHRCRRCDTEILYVDPGYSDDGQYVCIECQ